jgi:hypothetical protein
MHIRRRALHVPLIAELTPSLQVTSSEPHAHLLALAVGPPRTIPSGN